MNNNNIIFINYKKQGLDSPSINRKKIRSKTSFKKLNSNSKSELIDTKMKFIGAGDANQNNIERNKLKKNTKKRKNNKIKNSIKMNNSQQSNEENNINHPIHELMKRIKPDEMYKYFIDEEMNRFIYIEAIKIDYRTWLQYYWSLLKEKQLIIFTFINNKDYNICSIKFSLFICSFSIYFICNTFFFDDDSIHEKYKNSGNFNINHQIIKILISSCISIFVNIFLKLLSLQQKNILKLKFLEIRKAKIESINIYNCIKIKYFIFILTGIFILAFSWYYISCFCCVFKNSQIDLIKSITLSFIISMLYPIGITIIPVFFRALSLKDRKKDKKFLYDISKVISLIA